MFEVHRQAALAAIDAHEINALAVDERRAVAARVIACTPPLELDHIGAHVPEQHRAIGTGQDSREIQNLETF